MSFYNEIANILGFDWARIATGFSVINYNNEACYVEGIKRVVKVTSNQITLEVKNNKFCIFGSELEIFLLEENCIIVKGKISSTGDLKFYDDATKSNINVDANSIATDEKKLSGIKGGKNEK